MNSVEQSIKDWVRVSALRAACASKFSDIDEDGDWKTDEQMNDEILRRAEVFEGWLTR